MSARHTHQRRLQHAGGVHVGEVLPDVVQQAGRLGVDDGQQDALKHGGQLVVGGILLLLRHDGRHLALVRRHVGVGTRTEGAALTHTRGQVRSAACSVEAGKQAQHADAAGRRDPR